MCELENPEICNRPNASTVSWSFTKSQRDLERQLMDRYNARATTQPAAGLEGPGH
jgi:hypothetical protein